MTKYYEDTCRVFLSYAKEDIASARNLYEGLRNITFVEVWFDEKSLIPGQNWKKEISKAIKTSDIFIALISRNSTATNYQL